MKRLTDWWRNLMAAGCMLALVGSAQAAAKSCDLTFRGYQGTTTLADFQALVRLPTMVPGFSYDDFAAQDGSDIWFTDANGTVIPHEIDTWRAGGVSSIWVKVPSLVDASTRITMHWGEAKTAEQTTNPQDVWSAYKGVWHMNELKGTALDATVNGLNATVQGQPYLMGNATQMLTNQVADVMVADVGLVGNARINAMAKGTGLGYLSIPSYTLGNVFTVSGWFKASEAINDYQRLFARKTVYSGTGWEIYFNCAPNKVGAAGNNGTQVNNLAIPSVVDDWVNLVAIFSGVNYSLYANGVRVGGGTVAAPTDNGLPLSVGCNSNGSEKTFSGKYDEVRLRGEVLSADRIKADYETVHAPERFLSGCAPVTTVAKQADLTFVGFQGLAPQQNFQALVKLPAAVPSYVYADSPAADGSDIWFTDETGAVIPHDIDTWNPAGESYIWVKVPQIIDSTTHITMHWGVAKTAAQTTAATAVWSDYFSVWHMNEAAGPIYDATASKLKGFPQGTAATNMLAAAGLVGGARINAKTVGYGVGYFLTPQAALGATFTVSGWFYGTETFGAVHPRLFCTKYAWNDNLGWEMYYNGAPNKMGGCGSKNKQYHGLTTPSVLNGWRYATGIFAGDTFSLYVDGVKISSGAVNAATDSGKLFAFGCNANGTETSFCGFFDELRVRKAALDADRIKADYLTVHDPEAFLCEQNYAADAVLTAEWTGAGDPSNFADPANWTCWNAAGEEVPGGVPSPVYSRATVRGAMNFQLPVGTVPQWKRLILGNVDLTTDTDWRGLVGASTEIVGTVDLRGHRLQMTEFPAFGSGSITSTDADEFVTFDYLQSNDNGEYIDTGVAHNESTVVDIEYMPVNLPGNNAWTGYFGARTAGLTASSFVGWLHTENGFEGHYTGVNAVELFMTNLPPVKAFNKFAIHLEKNGECRINGQPVDAGSGGTCGLNDFLFCVNHAGKPGYNNKGRLFSCKMYAGSTPVRDFVSAMRCRTGEPGLFDRVENKFYTNLSGKGTFTPGGPRLDGRTIGEVIVDVPEGKSVANRTMRLIGLLKLVKEGAGAYTPYVANQFFVGGTLVKAGKYCGGTFAPNAGYGAAETEIRITSTGTMDMAGQTDFYFYKFVSEGGPLQNKGADASAGACQWASLRLEAPMTMDLTGSYGFIHYGFVPMEVDLGGNTLTVNLGVGKNFYVFNSTLTNGLVKVVSGGWMQIDRTRLEARTVDFDINCALKVYAEAHVRNYTARYGSVQYNLGSSPMNVYGTFTPACDCYYGCTMQNGSTIDLSAKTNTWSTLGGFTTGLTNVVFATGATVRLDVGRRHLSDGEKVLSWPLPPENLDTLTFKLQEGRSGHLWTTSEGVFYCNGLTIFLR